MAHWSHAAAAAVGGELANAGHEVLWFAPMRPGQVPPPPPSGVELRGLLRRPLPPLHVVAAEHQDLDLEQALTRSLRERPAHVLCHVGVGARGSPNLGWLAERLGSVVFAVAQSAEVVCHRGDLLDRSGADCREFSSPERCRRCCAASWWRRPSALAFLDRADSSAASLLAAEAVFVPTPTDGERLLQFGLTARQLVVAADAASIAARLTAR